MAIFNSYVSLPEGIPHTSGYFGDGCDAQKAQAVEERQRKEVAVEALNQQVLLGSPWFLVTLSLKILS